MSEEPRQRTARLELIRHLQFVKTNPECADGYVSLARSYVDAARMEEAAAALREAVRLDGERADTPAWLGGIYFELGNHAAAADSYAKSLAIQPQQAATLYHYGEVLLRLRRARDAVTAFERALQLEPDDAATHLGLGRALMAQGSMIQARRCLERAFALNPTLPGVSLNLARSHRFGSEDESTINKLEMLTEHPGMSERALSDLHFALGKIKDDCADHAQAFHHYRLANQIVAAHVSFDRERFTRALTGLTQTFSHAYFQAHRGSGQTALTPVFIVGMPRSGTTLVEQVLASHPSVYGADELPFIDELTRQLGASVPYPRAAARMDDRLAWELSEKYLQQITELAGDALRVTDKLPANCFHLGFIASLFPRARIVHCRREPLDVGLSVFFQQFETGNEWTYDLSDIGFFYRGYQQIMAHWRRVLPVVVHELYYEDLVSNHEPECRRLLEYCGLPWNPDCLRFYEQPRSVLTGSNWQVRQPLYSGSVNRWRHYEPYLDELKRALED